MLEDLRREALLWATRHRQAFWTGIAIGLLIGFAVGFACG